MKLFSLLVIIPLAAAVPAPDGDAPTVQLSPALVAESYLNPTTLKRQGDGTGQSRGPCPMLNTAANYDILPYNGRCIRSEHINALITKLGLNTYLAGFLAKVIPKIAAQRKAIEPNHATDCIDLEDLRWHGLEHDLSMSRWDVDLPVQKPNDQYPDPVLVTKLIDHCRKVAKDRGDKGVDQLKNENFMIDAQMLGSWHHERINLEKEHGHRAPDTGVKPTLTGAGEAGMVLTLFGTNGKVSAKHLRDFLLNHKYPKGWRVPDTGFSSYALFSNWSRVAAYYELSPSWGSWFKSKWDGIKALFSGDTFMHGLGSYANSGEAHQQ